ncbi:MAG: 4-alpha-glucanotransferase, partial [Vicinamibacteraceae bacterium]
MLLPLFSAASAEGWGIGEIPDLVTLAAWQRQAGLDFLLMLPVNELAPSGHHSPYATVSAMAIDPIYLRLVDIPEFASVGGVDSLSPEQRTRLSSVRQAPQVDYDGVHEVKQAALRAAFDRFDGEHWVRQTTRAADFVGFVQREADWLDDYALFRALRDRFESQPWWEWPDGLSTRQPSALDVA